MSCAQTRSIFLLKQGSVSDRVELARARARLAAALLVLAVPAFAGAGEPVPDAVCQECHAVPDLRFTDDTTGESILYTIDPEAYAASEHGGVACVTCHDSGYGDELPHRGPAMLSPFLCVSCHEDLGDLESLDLPGRRTQLRAGVHGDSLKPRLGCHECHDPHRLSLVSDRATPQDRIAASNAICASCHGPVDARPFGHEGLPSMESSHDLFPNPERHLARNKCVVCHVRAGTDHDVPAAEESLGDCTACHVRDDPAYQSSYAGPGSDGVDHVYVIGSTRSAWLDRASQLGFVFFLAMVLLHSVTRRAATGRWRKTRWLRVEGPLRLRLWHAVQVLLIAGLLISGLSMHYADSGLAPVPFRWAVRTHNVLGVANVLLWVGFVVGNRRSGGSRGYLQRLSALPRELPTMLRYYAWGAFRGETAPGPTQPGERFNPLQKLAYASVMYVISPLALVSGSLLLYPLLAPERALGHPGLWPMAMLHLSVGYAITLFVVVHVYMVGSGPERPDPAEPPLEA